MAIKWIQAAFEAEGVAMAPRMVLLAIADYANESGEAWPSVIGIAKKTGASRSTVMRSIRTLESLNILTAGRAMGVRTRYQILPPDNWKRCRSDTSVSEEPVSDGHPTSVTVIPDQCHGDTRTGSTVRPKPSRTVIEPSREPSRATSALYPIKGGEVWELTPDFVADLKADLSAPGLDIDRELAKALAWCKANPEKRKTKRGMKAFLTRWVARASEQAIEREKTKRKTPIEMRREAEAQWRSPDDDTTNLF